MQERLLTEDPDTPIRISGVNEIGHGSGNVNIENLARTVPWLQDRPGDDVWKTWDVAFRDLVILDRSNRRVAVFNLTEHNLDIPAEVEALRTLLLDIAAAPR